MKTNFIKSLPLAFLASASLVACSDEDFGYKKEELAFAKQFSEAFGKIDPNHDWNMAENASVTVVPNAVSDIKIYAKVGAQYRLVACYEDIAETSTLSFDVLDGTEDVMVSNGINSMIVPIGGTADFGGTRAIIEGSTWGVTISQTQDYFNFNTEIQTAYTQVCPEEDGTNPQRVTSNYTLVSNGAFTIYPVYFWTSSYSEIGLYYRDANSDIKYVPFYTMKQGDDFQYMDRDGAWHSYTVGDQYAHLADDYNGEKHYRSKGIIIDVPAGTVFGFYMKPLSVGNTVLEPESQFYNYSETELNVYTRVPHVNQAVANSWPAKPERDRISYSGFYTVGQRTYFSFEDWCYDCTDINDMVFMFDGDLPTPVDETATEWLVACEDLNVTGSFDDEDFNDIVFKVSHGSYKSTGYTSIQFTPLAAVGTYRSDIYVPRIVDVATLGPDSLIGEIHELVQPGVRPVSTNLYNVINGETVGTPGPSITVHCESSFSMDAYVPGIYNSDATDYYAKTKMGGFTIKSYRSADNASAEDAKVIAPNDVRGTAGAMFCIPASWTDANSIVHTWCWPKEMKNIATVYPRFTAWVGDMANNTDWYKDAPTPDLAVTGAYSINTSTGSGSDGSLNDFVYEPLVASNSNVVISILEGDPTEIITLSSGSEGAYTLVAGSTTYFDVSTNFASNETPKTITVTGKAVGSGTITVRQDAAGNYNAQTIQISVTITADYSPELAFENDEDANLSYPLNVTTKTVTLLSNSDGDLSAVVPASSPVSVAISQQPTWSDAKEKYVATLTLTTVREAAPTTIVINQAKSTVDEKSYDIDAVSLVVEVTAFQYTQPDGYETRIEAPAGSTAGWYRVSSILDLDLSNYTNGMKICVVLDAAPTESFTAYIGAGSNNKRVSATCAASATQFEFDVTAEELGNWHNWYSGSGLDLMDIPQSCPVNSVWVKAVAGSTPGGDSQDPAPLSNDYSSLGTSVDIDRSTIQYCNLIATSLLPNSGTVTITYVFSMTDNYKNFNNPYIKGKHWNDENQYNQYWQDIDLGDVIVSDIISGNPNYVTVSITVNATTYANCTYINYGSSYTNGTLIGAYYK